MYCEHCYAATGTKYTLDTSGPEPACPECGVVDSRGNLVAAHVQVGARIDVRTLEPYNVHRNSIIQSHKALQNYDGVVSALINSYVEDGKTCILQSPAPHLNNAVRFWLKKLREAEAEYFTRMARQRGNTKTKFKPGHSADVIKMPYLVVCAVRLASLDSTWPCLPVLSEECQRIKFPTRMDPVVPITLKNAFDIARMYPKGAVGHLKNFASLNTHFTKLCEIMNTVESTEEEVLACVYHAVERIKFLTSMDHPKRLVEMNKLVNRPNRKIPSKTLSQEILEMHWDFFNRFKIPWDHIMPTAQRLLHASNCVLLWNDRQPHPIAVALVIASIEAVTEQVMPFHTPIIRELSNYIGAAEYVAGERYEELNKMVISWTTSVIDAGLTYPQVNPPPVGGIGNGLTGWGSDKRRRIPENEMFVAAASLIARNWRVIASTRVTTRTKVLTCDEEFNAARLTYSKAGAKGTPLPPALIGKPATDRPPLVREVSNYAGILERERAQYINARNLAAVTRKRAPTMSASGTDKGQSSASPGSTAGIQDGESGNGPSPAKRVKRSHPESCEEQDELERRTPSEEQVAANLIGESVDEIVAVPQPPRKKKCTTLSGVPRNRTPRPSKRLAPNYKEILAQAASEVPSDDEGLSAIQGAYPEEGAVEERAAEVAGDES